MARLARYAQTVFASNATSNQIAQYGSLVATTPTLYSGATITPAIVQGLSQFASGWFGAAISTTLGYSPTMEDRNALDYLWSYQAAYVLQLGIPEWDAGTTYYIGSIAQNGVGTLYNSKINTNLNNALSNGTDWSAPFFAGVITPNVLPYASGMTVGVGSLTWPNLTIGNSQTVTVPTGASLVGITTFSVTGTGSLQTTGTGTIRIL